MRRKRLIRLTVAAAFVLLALKPFGVTTVAATSAGSHPHLAAKTLVDDTSSTSAMTESSIDMADCGGSVGTCSRALLRLIDRERAQHGLEPVGLKAIQSFGRASCPGSFGHSRAMAKSGSIWHTNPEYPRASFPHNVCLPFTLAGENVGESSSGNLMTDLQTMNDMMIIEPHSRADCATTLNHACILLNPIYHHVGIGIYVAHGTTWLTEDFIN